MRRIPAVLGLVFILAEGACPSSSAGCLGGCPSHDEERGTDDLQPGQSWTDTVQPGSDQRQESVFRNQ